MSRIANLVGAGLVLCAMPLTAEPVDTASFPVSLTIRESCLIQAPDHNATGIVQPQVSCLHGASHLARLLTSPMDIETVSTPPAKSVTWLIMF